jgi:PPOX class probable F420-dependent enzyme
MKHGARERFAAGRVARLATMSPGSRPHLVPVVFAVVGDTVWTAVDAKPKSTRSLRRLTNIEANPRVSLLVDHYEEDWSALWWVRVDGRARLVPVGSAEGAAGVASLVAKYPLYQAEPPPGPVVVITVDGWSSWSAR